MEQVLVVVERWWLGCIGREQNYLRRRDRFFGLAMYGHYNRWMGKYFLMVLLFIWQTCEKDDGYIGETRHGIGCAAAYVPECGCNDETYPSACEAR
jgi:hypothetical protein